MGKVRERGLPCIFCSSNEGYVCSGCVQKILAMSEDKLHAAFDLAMERGATEKAEVIGQLIGKEPEEYERQKRLELSKHNNRTEPLRPVGYQQKSTFKPDGKRIAVHSGWKGEENLFGAGCTSVAKVQDPPATVARISANGSETF